MPPQPIDHFELYRVLDANLNRATEALRVVEEIARFNLSDSYLARQLKQLRHELTGHFEPLQDTLLLARDTQTDVGTSISTSSEHARADLTAVLAANFDRLGQSLRSLEEFSKPLDETVAGAIERLRYESYTLEKAVSHHHRSDTRLQGKCLHAITGGEPDNDRFSEQVARLIRLGADVIQLRDKQLSDRELLERAKKLTELTRRAGVLSVINDRVDVALVAAATGVHIGQEDFSVAEVRKIAGDRLLVGVSTHSIEQARAAELDGADYIGAGPTFPSKTKQFSQFPGTQLLEEIAREIAVPCFAIGGIDADNIEDVLYTGVRRVAVQRALSNPNTAATTAATLKSLISQHDAAAAIQTA